MSILGIFAFFAFFGLIGPVFLYWFVRFSKNLMTKPLSFIGFPEDNRRDRPPMPPAALEDTSRDEP